MTRPWPHIVSVLAALAVLSAPAAGQETARYDGPIIDMHMHALELTLGPDGKPLPLPCYPDPCQGAPAVAASEDDVLRMTLQAMDRKNIVKGFLSGDLARVSKWRSAAADRFIGSPLIWRPGEPSVETLRREYAAGRLKGMGELATQYHGFRPNDPALEPYFALAEELDIPEIGRAHV